MGKFLIKKTNTGYTFNLKAANGETIATSEVYNTKSSCMSGIKSVKTNAPIARLEDLTDENTSKVTNPKFETYLDKAGEYRFRLKARNGKVIAVSEGYSAKKSCMNGVESVRKNSPDAKIENER